MNKNNGDKQHSIWVTAVSDDGVSFGEKELREIIEYLKSRGFVGQALRIPIETEIVKFFG